MEDRRRVFIKGIPGRGKDVIKALTNLGANNCAHYAGRNPHCLFYINHKGIVDWAPLDSETGQIIIDYYKEIKLPEKWNDGDILINNDGTYYKVFSDYDPDNANIFYAYNVSISVEGIITQFHDGVWTCSQKDYRLATSTEVEHFFDLLHASNKDWDAKKKRVVDTKWRPKMYGTFWVVSGNGHIVSYAWNDSPIDNEFFNFGNCFKTREEAEAMVEKIKKLLNAES